MLLRYIFLSLILSIVLFFNSNSMVTTRELSDVNSKCDNSGDEICDLRGGGGFFSSRYTSIAKNAFTGLTNLQELNLTSNEISTIPSNAFKGLTKLQELYLYDNQISTIESDAFKGLTSLQLLYLGGNQISTIPSNAFKGLTKLQELDLYGNQISTIQQGAFKGLTSLQKLYLYGNQILTISSNAFKGLTSLQGLYLGDNQISTIPSNAFKGLTSLQGLYLGFASTIDTLDKAKKIFEPHLGEFKGTNSSPRTKDLTVYFGKCTEISKTGLCANSEDLGSVTYTAAQINNTPVPAQAPAAGTAKTKPKKSTTTSGSTTTTAPTPTTMVKVCNNSNDCAKDEQCVKNDCTKGEQQCAKKVCKGRGGHICAHHNECVSNKCNVNAKKCLGALLNSCQKDEECANNLVCGGTSKKCRLKTGQSCNSSDPKQQNYCLSGACIDNTCK